MKKKVKETRLNIIEEMQNIYDEAAPFSDYCGGEELDSYLCSEFILGMRQIIQKIEEVLVNNYELTEDVPVFNYLYNLRDLRKDYSWLLRDLDEVEINQDYDEYTISNFDMDTEDIRSDVQNLIDETIELLKCRS